MDISVSSSLAATSGDSPILRAANVGKIYHVLPRLRSLFADPAQLRAGRDRVAALESVSFDVARGSALAVIGANGAGKSTLLRILAGLSRPSTGRVECRARIGTLLDLGAGLVDEWTGEVNARSALTLQGLPASRLDAIVAFAELGSFFSEPVRTYSTGMRLRLAYALAIGMAPDLLIADEVVAVGDESFQRRCALELQRFLGAGGTLILATHNLYLADKLCQHTLWLERGRVRESGVTRDVTAAYRDAALGSDGKHRLSELRSADDRSERRAGVDVPVALVIENVAEEGGDGVVTIGSPWAIRIDGAGDLRPGAWIDVRRVDGTLVGRVTPTADRTAFEACSLLPGRFLLELCESAASEGSTVRARASLLVRGTRRELGSVLLEHEWR